MYYVNYGQLTLTNLDLPFTTLKPLLNKYKFLEWQFRKKVALDDNYIS